MANQCIAQTPLAYGFPLLIKGLLESGVTRAPEQEIVSADSTRLTYREFAERVGRLAHWRRGSAAGARPRSPGAWARHLRWLRHVGDLSPLDALRSQAEMTSWAFERQVEKWCLPPRSFTPTMSPGIIPSSTGATCWSRAS